MLLIRAQTPLEDSYFQAEAFPKKRTDAGKGRRLPVTLQNSGFPAPRLACWGFNVLPTSEYIGCSTKFTLFMSEALNMLQQLDNRKFKVFYYVKLADIVVEEFEPKLTILCLSKYL